MRLPVVLDRRPSPGPASDPAGPRPTWPRRAGARWSALPARRRRRPRRPASASSPGSPVSSTASPAVRTRSTSASRSATPCRGGAARSPSPGAAIWASSDAQRVQRLPGAVPDRLERAAGGRGVAVEHVQPHAGLHRDHGEPVPDAVVQLLRHVQLLLGGGGADPLGRACARDRVSVPIGRPSRDHREHGDQLPQRPLVVEVGDGPDHQRGADRQAPRQRPRGATAGPARERPPGTRPRRGSGRSARRARPQPRRPSPRRRSMAAPRSGQRERAEQPEQTADEPEAGRQPRLVA